jgi:hypothetical protein
LTQFLNNLEAIRRKNKLLAKSLEATTISDNVEIVLSKQSMPVIKYKGNFLSSKYNPIREAESLFDNINNKTANYLFVFGFPNCIIGEVFGNPASNQTIIVFEPSLEILKQILTDCNLDNFLNNKQVFVFSDLNNLDNFLHKKMIPGETFEFVINASYKKFFLTEIKKFVETVKNVQSIKSVHASTVISYGPDFAKQNLSNLFNLNNAAPIAKLHNQFLNVPAVIVSPGPSLAKNIKLLREIKGKAIIISTAPALAVMEKWNIRPDFVNAIEAQNFSYQIKKYENFLDESYLLLLSQCHPEFFKIKSKGIFTYFTAGEKSGVYLSAKNKIFDKGILASGGSVSTDAFFTAYYLGCSPIILVGQDLAISGSKNYSMFTLEEDAQIQQSGNDVVVASSKRVREITNEKDGFFKQGPKKQIVETKGLFQKQVKSKTDYFTFKAWFENTANNIIGRKLYNATEGGVFIEGFSHMPLSLVLKELIDLDVSFSSEILDKVFRQFKPAKELEVIHFLKGEKIALKNIMLTAEKLLEGFKRAVYLGQKGREKESAYTFSKTYKKQESFSKKIDKLFILEAFLEEELIRLELINRNLQQIEKKVLVEANMNFLKKTIDAAKQILEVIEKLLEGKNN